MNKHFNHILAVLSLFTAMSITSCKKEIYTPEPEPMQLPRLDIREDAVINGYYGDELKIEFSAVDETTADTRILAETTGCVVLLGQEFRPFEGTGYVRFLLREKEGEPTGTVMIHLTQGKEKKTYTCPVEPYYLRILLEDIALSAEAGGKAELVYTIETNIPDFKPVISVDCPWLTLEKETLIVTGENDTDSAREALITIADPNGRFRPFTAKAVQASKKTGTDNPDVPAVPERPAYPPVVADGFVQFAEWPFKDACLAAADKDGDGEVSFEEARQVKHLNASGYGVRDITGLEKFIGIESVDLSHNLLTDVVMTDYATYYMLKDINLVDNPLVHIDVSGTYFGPSRHVKLFDDEDTRIYTYEEAMLDSQIGSSIRIYESKYDASNERDVVFLQRHTKGFGIYFVFDCNYTNDLDFKSGAMDEWYNAWMENIFSVEPFASFRDCFSICYVKTTEEKKSGDKYKFREFTDELKESKNCVIYIQATNAQINAAGTVPALFSFHTFIKLCHGCTGTFPFQGGVTNYVLLTGIPTGTSSTMHHELGHAFGGLDEEYREQTLSGIAINASPTDNPEKVPWARFLMIDKYKGRVGIYPCYGGYKPSPDSMMCAGRDKMKQFNTPSRYGLFCSLYAFSEWDPALFAVSWDETGNNIDEIRQRMDDMDIENFLFEKFLEYDVVNDDLPI